MRCTVTARIVTPHRGSWWVADADERGPEVKQLIVFLAIEGDDVHGYHLVQSPENCCTFDSWHLTREQALAAAEAQFGAPRDGWG